MCFRLKLFGLVTVVAIGCGPSAPGLKPEPVAVQGVVKKADGQPVSDVTINFLPMTSSQNQAGASLKQDGKFNIKMVPGTYHYVIEGAPAALKAVPEKYQKATDGNTIEVPAGGTSDLTVQLQS